MSSGSVSPALVTWPVTHAWRGPPVAPVSIRDVETAPSVFELGALLLAAVAAGWLARRFGLPAVIGYLVLGVAVSPFTPGFVADREQLQLLADVGVVLLLFEVGIEVDLWRLRREHGQLAWAAPLQVLVTTGLTAAIVMALGLEPVAAVVIGLAIALSSSVVIVNITRSRRRTTDHTDRGGHARLERGAGRHGRHPGIGRARHAGR